MALILFYYNYFVSLCRFQEENTRRLELNQRCRFLSTAAMQWLNIRLQLIGVAVVSSLGAIAVVQHQYASVDPGESGSKEPWDACQ